MSHFINSSLLLLFLLSAQSLFASYPEVGMEINPMAGLNRVEDAQRLELPENEPRLFLYPRLSEDCKQIFEATIRKDFVIHQYDIKFGPLGKVEEITNDRADVAKANRIILTGYALNLLNRSTYAWPKGIIPFTIDENLEKRRKVILGAIKEWNTKTNVTFVHFELEAEWLKEQFGNVDKLWRIHFIGHDKDYSTSYVGLRKFAEEGRPYAQTIELTKDCAHGTVLHEMGHALGLWHEHNRPDRDQFINIINENIREAHRNQYDIGRGKSVSDYDLQSIMHYSQHTFALDDKVSFTVINTDTIEDPANIGYMRRVSPGDIEAVNAIYPKQIAHPAPFIVPGPTEEGERTTTTLSSIDFGCHTILASEKEQYKKLVFNNLPIDYLKDESRIKTFNCVSAPAKGLDRVNCIITLAGENNFTVGFRAIIDITSGEPKVVEIGKY